MPPDSPPSPAPGRFALLLLGVFVLALGVRVALAATFVGLYAPPDAGAQPDQVDYERYAWNLAATGVYGREPGVPSAFRPPGTSLALYPVYALLGRNWAAARLWFCVLSAATCVAAGLLGRAMFGARVGALAAVALALLPGHAYFAMHFLSEGPYLLWLTLAAWGALRAFRGGRPLAALAAGLALGAAVLTRPQALLLLPAAAAAVVLAREGRRPRALLRFGALVLGSALVVAPWVARNAQVLGKPTLSTVGGCTFWGAHNERVLSDPSRVGSWIEVTALADTAHPLHGNELEEDRLCWKYGLEFVREHPGDLPRLLGWKLWRLVTPFAYARNPPAQLAMGLSWTLAALLAVPGFLLAWRRDRLAALVLALPLLATVATALLFYGSVRFRQSVATFYVLPAALAAAELVRRRAPRAPRASGAEPGRDGPVAS